MAAFDEPDLLEEDFPVTTKRTTVMSDDREELDHQATSLQTKLAELNRAREKLEREKATVEDSRRRFSEFQTGREEMMHELSPQLLANMSASSLVEHILHQQVQPRR